VGVTELGKLIGREARREIKLENLAGRCVALDAYNALYQFLASIRQPDGPPSWTALGGSQATSRGFFTAP